MNNLNFQQPSNFTCGSKAFGDLQLMIKAIAIPGINMNPMPYNGRAGAKFQVTSDTIEYDALDIDIYVDENFVVYKELMSIVKKNINIDTGTFGDFQFDLWVEGGNNLGNSRIKWEFHGCRIMNVGGMAFDSSDESTERTVSLTLSFDYFEIVDNVQPTLRV